MAGSVLGCLHGGRYVAFSIDGRYYLAHRLAWVSVTGEWPRGEIDHWDTNGLNNAWKNLRDVTKVVNMQNLRCARKDNKTGLLGASWSERDGLFRACIRVDGKQRYLGMFDSAEAAHAAYVKAKRELHEGNTL